MRSLHKSVNSRTYKYRLLNANDLRNKFSYTQQVERVYFNYALKYLYQHYGVGHLSSYFPTGARRQYLIKDLKQFARLKAQQHNFSLKKLDYNVQSIDKMLEQLCVNFEKYHKKQYQINNYWSESNKQQYLRTHTTNLSEYYRIGYKHQNNLQKSVYFKYNNYNIEINNNYNIKVPYFKNMQTIESLTHLKGKKILGVIIIKRKRFYELQVVTKFEKEKEVSDLSSIEGLDVNLANNEFFVLSSGEIISWTDKVANDYNKLDTQSRSLQHYLTTNRHRFDNSKRTKYKQAQLTRIKAKMKNILDSWELNVARYLSKTYPVLAMEQLDSFELRLSKRAIPSLRKNTNHKLAKLQPTEFRQYMENVYQNDGHILFEVNSIDTSKTCNYCNHINHDLKVGTKHWVCPSCGREINRDQNATFNIRDWALNPSKHAVMQQQERFRYLDKSKLVVQY